MRLTDLLGGQGRRRPLIGGFGATLRLTGLIVGRRGKGPLGL
jgi:hypothetical protein